MPGVSSRHELTTATGCCMALLLQSSRSCRELKTTAPAARVICQQRRCVHAIPLLKTVHWLPVQQCTQYKIADIMHRALSTSVTPYIDELLQCQVMSWSLWSIDALCLSVSWTCTETAKRAFCVAAANVWNSLPNDIRNASSLFTFRAKLKILFYCCIPVLVMNMPPSHLCIDF